MVAGNKGSMLKTQLHLCIYIFFYQFILYDYSYYLLLFAWMLDPKAGRPRAAPVRRATCAPGGPLKQRRPTASPGALARPAPSVPWAPRPRSPAPRGPSGADPEPGANP